MREHCSNSRGTGDVQAFCIVIWYGHLYQEHVLFGLPLCQHNFVHDDVIKWKHFPRYFSLCGEFTGHRWIPLTKASDADIWCFFDLRLNTRLRKQAWRWWFDTPSRSLWRHCTVHTVSIVVFTHHAFILNTWIVLIATRAKVRSHHIKYWHIPRFWWHSIEMLHRFRALRVSIEQGLTSMPVWVSNHTPRISTAVPLKSGTVKVREWISNFKPPGECFIIHAEIKVNSC